MENRSLTVVKVVMEQQDMGLHFSVEAKNFFFAVREDRAEVRLEERRKAFVGCVFLGVQGSTWLVDKVEEVLKSPGIEDFAKCSREDERMISVHGGGNKAGRFLKVSAFVEGKRKGSIWIPKGRGGWGCHRFAGELRHLLIILQAKMWPLVSEVPLSEGKHKGGSSRSYAEALCSVDRVDEKVGLIGRKFVCSGPPVASYVSAKKTSKTKGSSISYRVKLF
jgi:hypothetical protein